MATSTLVLTVSELTRAIKFKLEGDFPRIYVQGEVSNFKRQASGHLYFTLKDAQSQIQAVMFSSDARTLQRDPKVGDQVQVVGSLNVYPPRGNYQIVVRSLKASGLGELLLLLEERKKKYLSLGYFSKENKKPIPQSPKTIGVISSPTGAVIRDILQILSRRSVGYHVLLNPVRVQGTGAKEEISQAIDDFNRLKLADVLIVARGGGSMEDLWPFNEPCVIESIYQSDLPIVAAIGHETDVTLADLTADLRAPTPSAAAELVSIESKKTLERLTSLSVQFKRVLSEKIGLRKRALSLVKNHPFILTPHRLLQPFEQRIDEILMQMDQDLKIKLQKKKEILNQFALSLKDQSPSLRIEQAKSRLDQIKQRLDQTFLKWIQGVEQRLSFISEKMDRQIESNLQKRKLNFEKIWTHLQAIHPKKLLEKGYSILFDENQKSVILSTQDITLKQKVKVVLKDGFIKASIDEIHPGAS